MLSTLGLPGKSKRVDNTKRAGLVGLARGTHEMLP